MTDLLESTAFGSRNLAQPENNEGVYRKTDVHLHVYAARQWPDGLAGQMGLVLSNEPRAHSCAIGTKIDRVDNPS